ncbi:Rh53 [macacine betaherpesvirus 3]|nr:Rh53 [macacine betaherpesvirus 3]QQL11087.1 Rh53 [macacine betaherpesvirus 3]QQL11443.1 Rh53 [macacine betaherpesvirus 3]
MAARSVQWVYFWEMRVRWCLKPQLDMDGIEAFCEFYSTLSIRDQDDFNREVDLGVQHRRLQQLRRARQNLKRDCICSGG